MMVAESVPITPDIGMAGNIFLPLTLATRIVIPQIITFLSVATKEKKKNNDFGRFSGK